MFGVISEADHINDTTSEKFRVLLEQTRIKVWFGCCNPRQAHFKFVEWVCPCEHRCRASLVPASAIATSVITGKHFRFLPKMLRIKSFVKQLATCTVQCRLLPWSQDENIHSSYGQVDDILKADFVAELLLPWNHAENVAIAMKTADRDFFTNWSICNVIKLRTCTGRQPCKCKLDIMCK